MTDHEKIYYNVALMPSGRKGKIKSNTNLLEAARELGVELESICGSRQTCGKCQIVVEEGHFPKHGITSHPQNLSPPGKREADYIKKHKLSGRRLACAAEVCGELLISVPAESQARKQTIAKAVTDRVIEVDPAIRQLYVEVTPAELGDNRGDWERLQEALAKQWNLTNLSIDIRILPTLSPALKKGNHAVTVTLWQDTEVLRVLPGYSEGIFGLAVDVGTTTVAVHLCDLRTGEVLATQAAMNPQVKYGEDLMSRVSYAIEEPQGMNRLNRAIIRTLNELAKKAADDAELAPTDIMEVVLVANTVMHHILLGINPEELGGAPFALAVDSPLDIKARDLGIKLHPAARVHIMPLIAGHVGADNVGVLLAEAPYEQDEIMLIVDVGTNAEILLGNRKRVLSASSPTGPAFEGAQITHGQRAAPGAIERVRIDPETLEPTFKVIGYEDWIEPRPKSPIPPEAQATGICGSGIIEVVAELFTSGIINADGLFNKDAVERSPRVRFMTQTGEYVLVDESLSSTGSPIIITQNDIRAIQLGKSALYTGTKLLMNHLGVKRVDRVVLAGAFGSFISPRHAMTIGMIPDCDLNKVTAVGNAAGDGARIALLNRKLRSDAARQARRVEYVETPLESDFLDEFVAALALPHAHDTFSTLEAILPKARPKDEQKSRKYRQRNEYQIN